MGFLSVKRRGSAEEDSPYSFSSSTSFPKRTKHQQGMMDKLEPDVNADAVVDHSARMPSKAKGVHFRHGLVEIVKDDQHNRRTAFEHDLCWYTTKDYLTFMRERLDTVRVYQSVSGDLRYLQEFYTVRGLEHLLEMRQYLAMQRNQREVVRGVILAKRRNLSVESIRQISLERSAESVQRALCRATSPETAPARTSPPRRSKLRCAFSPSAYTPSSLVNHITPPMALLSRHRVPVDVRSLRVMNTRLLQQMPRPRLVTPTLTSADTTRRMLLQAALSVPFPGIHDESSWLR